MDGMKVAFVMDSVSRKAGGLLGACQRLAQRGRSGHGEDVRVFGVRDAETENDLPSWSPVPVSVSEASGPRSLAFAPGLGSALEAFAPDVVHVHGLWNYPSWAGWRRRRKTGKAEVIHPHGMLDPWALNHSRWKKKLALKLFERAHLSGASCLRALCEAERAAILALNLGVPICVVPNGIDLPVEVAAPARRSESGVKTLLYLGRLHRKKGLLALLEAWAAFAKQRPQATWRLVVAGWDQDGHEQELQESATHLGLRWLDSRVEAADLPVPQAGTVEFCGPKFGSDKEALYREADAFVLPSLSEGLPMVVLEAWAHSLPVLMTPMCNLPEGFENGAAVCAQPEAGSLTEALLRLEAMPSTERSAMGLAGRRLVAERFTWEKVAAQLAAVNAWLVGGGPAPACVRQ